LGNSKWDLDTCGGLDILVNRDTGGIMKEEEEEEEEEIGV